MCLQRCDCLSVIVALWSGSLFAVLCEVCFISYCCRCVACVPPGTFDLDIAAQTEGALDNLSELLARTGADLSHLVDVTVSSAQNRVCGATFVVMNDDGC